MSATIRYHEHCLWQKQATKRMEMTGKSDLGQWILWPISGSATDILVDYSEPAFHCPYFESPITPVPSQDMAVWVNRSEPPRTWMRDRETLVHAELAATVPELTNAASNRFLAKTLIVDPRGEVVGRTGSPSPGMMPVVPLVCRYFLAIKHGCNC